jgi:putative MATE family efflux protein
MMGSAINIEELGRGKISKLLWKYALPAIIGTTLNSLYNIIDGIFVGQWIGDDALSGLGIVLPIMNLTAAVGMLVGAGSSSRVSIALGADDKATAEKIAGTSFLMTFILSGGVIGLIYLFLKPILIFAGANEDTLPYAYNFLLVFLPGNLFLSLCFNFNNIMRASGYPIKAMLTMILTVVVNIVLAPVFMKWFGWGIKGAAAATFAAMFIGFVFVMQHFISPRSYIRLRWKNVFKGIEMKTVKSIVSIGMSPFLIQVTASVVVFFIIAQLNAYGGENGKTAIGAYTIANRLIMLLAMIIIGLTQGMQPIVGYNYGAKNFLRVRQALNYTIKVGVIIMTVGFAFSQLFPDALVAIFGPDKLLAEESATALKYITFMFPLVGFQIVITNFFQSIGLASKAIFLSLTRQVIILTPLLFFLPRFFGITGVWLSMPSADFISTLIAIVFYIVQAKKLKVMEGKAKISA